MAFARPTLSDLVDRVSTDIMTRLGLAGVALRRSVVGVLARALAGAAHGLHGHVEWVSQQILPDTAESEFLDRHASFRFVTRLAATTATGTVTVTGADGAVAPSGTVLQRSDGSTYTTQADATIASGTATVAVEADSGGAAGNAEAGVAVTFVSPVSGVNASAVVAGGGLTGGADAEIDTALRARLLDVLRNPPQGGSMADYVKWAKEVSGVTRVWVYPRELATNGVTVRFVRDGDGTGSAIIPDSGEVADVQAYIDDHRPVTAVVTVVAPVAMTLAVTLSITPDTSATRAAVSAELADLLQRLAEPGVTLPLSQVNVAAGAADGVEDFTITVPSADVVYATGQIPVAVSVTFV